jgi:hypothetical protein
MITLDVVSNFVYEICENVTTSKNGTHFLARCPICGDSKKNTRKRRFNLDYNNGNPIYHCFNCPGDDGSGTFLQLYSTHNRITISQALKDLSKYDPDYLTQKLSDRKKNKVVDDIEHDNFNYILKDCIDEHETVNSIVKKSYQVTLQEFISDRCIPDDYMLYIAYSGKYQGRIIIPIRDKNNDIVYFQARATDSSMLPKYDNPTLQKGDAILNKPNFDRDNHIIITEGILDAIVIGNQGTTCLGTYITDDFIKELSQLTDKGIIIALDNDEAGQNGVLKFIKDSIFCNNVRYFMFPRKYNYDDINKYVMENSDSDVYQFVIDNTYSKMAILSYLKLGGKC